VDYFRISEKKKRKERKNEKDYPISTYCLAKMQAVMLIGGLKK
jgi:hypothetical protein